MTVRPPTLTSRNTNNPLEGLLDYEIAGEMASILGRAGRQVERALRRYKGTAEGDRDREARLDEAVSAVYAYLIQREIMGFRRHGGVIREYDIPKEVLVRLGASK